MGRHHLHIARANDIPIIRIFTTASNINTPSYASRLMIHYKTNCIRFLRFFFCLFLLGQNDVVFSQQDNFRFEKISTESGLSQSSVVTILKDSQGFLWFGTFNGLNRYDGKTFEVYQPDNKDSTSLSCGNIRALYEDSQGNIWVGTVTGGAYLFDRKFETFVSYRPDNKGRRYLSGYNISSIHEDYEGNIWIGTDGSGLNVINKYQANVRVLKHNPDDTTSLSSNNIRVIYEDSKKNLWIGTLDTDLQSGGLNVFKRETGTFTRYISDPDDFTSIGSNLIKSVYEDGKGRLWVGTDNGGLNRFNYFSNDFTRSDILFSEWEDYVDIWSITEGSNDILWLGTPYSGVLQYNIQNGQVRQFTPNADNPYSIPSFRIWDIYYDPSGILWAGTHGGGIARINFNTPRYNHYQTIPNNHNSIRSNNVRAVYYDSKGILWIGTIDGGLSSMNKKNEFTNYILKQNDQPHLEASSIYTIAEARPGEIWIATNKGLFIYNKSEKHFRPFRSQDYSNPFLNNPVSALAKDTIGNIWVSTWNNGLFWIDPSNKVHAYTQSGDFQFNQKWISTLYVDRKNRIWFSAEDQGFFKIDQHENTFRQYLWDTINQKRINKVYTFFEDNTGELWLGGDNALLKFNPENEQFEYPLEGFNQATIVGILQDNYHRLWLSTTQGIFSFNLNTSSLEPLPLGERSGYTEYNEASHLIIDNQEMYFGSKNGLISFFPENILKNHHIPPVRITDFQIFYKSITPGENSPIQRHISQVNEMKLSHKESTFTFRFAALDYTNPNKNQYATILEGFEKDWVQLGERNEVSYTNIPPGKYNFRVKGSNNDGVWNEKGTAIRITITPPFYANRWFVGLAIILGVSMVFFFFSYRIRYIKARKKELEKLVEQRTEELLIKQELLEQQTTSLQQLNQSVTNQNRELEQQKDQIHEQKDRIQKMARKIHIADQMKIQFFTNISHEFRTPLTLILGVIERLTDSELTKTSFYEPLRVMQRNSNRLLKLINELLDFSKLEHNSLKLTVANGNIVEFTQSVFYAFIYRAERRDIQYEFHSELSFCKGYFDGDKLEKILYNLISNAFKFTSDRGQIYVTMDFVRNPGDQSITLCNIRIKDNGTGIEQDKLEKIFKRFYQDYDPANSTGHSTGIGLSLAEALARIHYGEITVSSTPGVGSEFVLNIPLARQYYKDDEMGSGVPMLSDNLIMEEIREGLMNRLSFGESESKKFQSFRKLLVIDDNADIRTFINDELKGDFEIHQASDGEEGWEKINLVKPEIIICDILMPKVDGISLCKRLKDDDLHAHIPIIMLTAVSNEEVQLKGYEIGADDYITKPFNVKVLRVRVENLLLQRARLREKFSREPFIETSELTSNSMNTQFLQKAIKIVEDNIFNPDFDNQQFINAMAMSKTQLYRKLTSTIGQSATEFIRTIKLKKAARIIACKEMTISEITYQMGFNDPSYFTKVFKKQFGMLPSSYAEHYAEKVANHTE